ncbi:MAG: FAD:protein FMN transferase [Firmicutes bacterium]|nr:FAD:protein FMN transferase [Bacillota bacterium]
MKKLWIILLIILVFVVGVWVRLGRQEVTVNKSLFAMGTVFEITATGADADQVIADAFKEIQRIESLTSNQSSTGLTKVNQMAGSRGVKVEPGLITILNQVSTLYPGLSGSFDPTVGSLIDLWGFNPDRQPHLPEPDEIRQALLLVDFERVILDDQAETVFLLKEGMKLDLGGIAKGYAVDRAYLTLKKSGVRSALINGGSSSIRALGNRADGNPWRLGIGHPRLSGKLLGTLSFSKDQALGTSADTQNFFIHQGKRYSHLIDPKTGYPARHNILVTATAPTAMEADLLSTAFFIMSLKEVESFIKANPQYGAVIYNASEKLINLTEDLFRSIDQGSHP